MNSSTQTTMKIVLIVVCSLISTLAAVAIEPSSAAGSDLYAQNYNSEQVIRAYYVYNGRLVSIKVKINHNQVVAYSTGKDFAGRDNWVSVIPPSSIRSTSYSFDGDMAREFSNTATLVLSNGLQAGSLKIFF